MVNLWLRDGVQERKKEQLLRYKTCQKMCGFNQRRQRECIPECMIVTSHYFLF